MVMLGDEKTCILEEAAEGLAILENEVITAEFHPTDPASVEAAVAHVESVIDAKVARFRGNRLVANAADERTGNRTAIQRLGRLLHAQSPDELI